VEPTYDIEVSGHHNFIANGILVHNSMAAPQVAGALAVLMGSPHRVAADQAAQALYESATDVAPAGLDPRTGFGAINLRAAVEWARGTRGERFQEGGRTRQPTTLVQQSLASTALAAIVIVGLAVASRRRRPAHTPSA
jgi:hypothetical protein